MRLLLPALAAEIEGILAEDGLALGDLLASLRAERRRIYAEHWKPALAAAGIDLSMSDVSDEWMITAEDDWR